MYRNYVAPDTEYPDLEEREKEAYRRQLVTHSIGVSAATATAICSGLTFSLYSYNALFRIDRKDRIGLIEDPLTPKQLIQELFYVKFRKMFSCYSLKSMFLRHLPACLSNTVVNKKRGIATYLISQFVGTMISYPFEHIMHRCLFECKKDWNSKSYWRGFLYRLIGKVVGDVTSTSTKILLKKICDLGLNVKRKVFGYNRRTERRIKNVYNLSVVRFGTKIATYYVTDPFYSKSFGIQLGHFDSSADFFDFSDLPKRNNMFNLCITNSSMGLFQELIETYLFFGVLKWLEACSLIYRDNYFYHAHHYLQFLKDATDNNQEEAEESKGTVVYTTIAVAVLATAVYFINPLKLWKK